MIKEVTTMKVTVLGAGIMGRNIALVYLQARIPVMLYSRSQETLESARLTIKTRLKEDLSRLSRTTTSEKVKDSQHHFTDCFRLSLTTSIEEATADADLILESVSEIPALKQKILMQAESANSGQAIIGTNTSSLPLKELAAVLKRPQQFLGMHWFNPAHLIPLVEVVPAEQTDRCMVQKIYDHLLELGKRPIILRGELPGYIANRLQDALIREACSLIEKGAATPEQIDLVMTECLGLRWAVTGPMQSIDLAGMDTAVVVARQLYPQLATDRSPQQLLIDMHQEGRSFYNQEPGVMAEQRDRQLIQLLKARGRRSDREA